MKITVKIILVSSGHWRFEVTFSAGCASKITREVFPASCDYPIPSTLLSCEKTPIFVYVFC